MAKAKYVQGDYKLVIKTAQLGELSTGTPFVELTCDIVNIIRVKGSRDLSNIGEVYVKLWLSDKAQAKSFEFLKAAGFNSPISELSEPNDSMEGFQFNGSNKHNDQGYDSFSAYPIKQHNKVNTSRLMQLDALFGCNTIQAPVKKVNPVVAKPVQVQTEPGQDFEDEDLPF
jgi:hypothetical protein